MTASDRVDIRGEGSLTGDVVAQRISIEDGAYFKGGIDIRKPGQKVNGEAKETTPLTTSTGPTAAALASRCRRNGKSFGCFETIPSGTPKQVVLDLRCVLERVSGCRR